MSEHSNQGMNLWAGLPVHPGVAARLLRESVDEPSNEVLLRKTIAMDPAAVDIDDQIIGGQAAGLGQGVRHGVLDNFNSLQVT